MLLVCLLQSLLFIGYARRPSVEDCTMRWFDQPLDHSDPRVGSFKQKYYVCRAHKTKPKHLFFYTGNESPVEVYVNNTGLMWDSAEEFSALVVFAEHRFYGESFPPDWSLDLHVSESDMLSYLRVASALSDYALLIADLKKSFHLDKTVVFGGSYGGMLAARMRIEYPSLVQGAIASSAPVIFSSGLSPRPDPFAFYQRITSAMGMQCSTGFKRASELIHSLADSTEGVQKLKSTLRLCPGSPVEAQGIIAAMQEPWVHLAMGNYGFSSNYIIAALTPRREEARWPNYPLRVACDGLEKCGNDHCILEGFREAAGLWYNATGSIKCFDFSGETINSEEYVWGYQYCYEMTFAFNSGSSADVFAPFQINSSKVSDDCYKKYKVRPDVDRQIKQFGTRDDYSKATNIFFANGGVDPWTDYSVNWCSGDSIDEAESSCSSSVRSFLIADGAHHADLMFSLEYDDAADLKQVRIKQRDAIREWLSSDDTIFDDYSIVFGNKAHIVTV